MCDKKMVDISESLSGRQSIAKFGIFMRTEDKWIVFKMWWAGEMRKRKESWGQNNEALNETKMYLE